MGLNKNTTTFESGIKMSDEIYNNSYISNINLKIVKMKFDKYHTILTRPPGNPTEIHR